MAAHALAGLMREAMPTGFGVVGFESETQNQQEECHVS